MNKDIIFSQTKIMRVVIMILIFVMFTALHAGTEDKGTAGMWLNALSPLVVVIFSPLIIRLFRKLGIDIEESILEPILMRIIEIIASVDQNKSGMSGGAKKEMVSAMSKTLLSGAEQRILVKKYGSIDTAVQAAFERSSLAGKHK